MKKRINSVCLAVFVVLIVIVVASVGAKPVSPGQSEVGKFLRADFSTRQRIREIIRTRYPDLRKEIFEYVSRTFPNLPSGVLAANSRMVAEKYPALPVRLPRVVLQDLSVQHPSLIMDIAVDVSKLISEKYPDLPGELVLLRGESGKGGKMKETIAGNHPGFAPDVRKLMIQKRYGRKLSRLRGDIGEMMEEKHPELISGIRDTVREVIVAKYPELPAEVSGINDNPNMNPRFAVPELLRTKYPRLIPDILEVVRDKHGKEIQQAVIDFLELVEVKHPELVTDLPRDISELIADKYPGLPVEIARNRMDMRFQRMEKIDKKYPQLRSDIKTLVESKYVLSQRITRSVENHYPELKNDVADVLEKNFGENLKSLHQEMKNRHPKLLEEIDRELSKK